MKKKKKKPKEERALHTWELTGSRFLWALLRVNCFDELIFVTDFFFPQRPSHKHGLRVLFRCIWARYLLSGLTVRQVSDAGYNWSERRFRGPTGSFRFRSLCQGGPREASGSCCSWEALGDAYPPRAWWTGCLRLTPGQRTAAQILSSRSSGKLLGRQTEVWDLDPGAPDL